MRNGSIDVGTPSPTRRSDQKVPAEPASGSGVAEPVLTMPRPGICGAMAQQRGESGPSSAPQGLVQLVGCRDPKIMAEALAEQVSAVRRNHKF